MKQERTKSTLREGWPRVLVLYSVLALALTWPLAARFTTHVPGDGIDDPALAWNLWWIKARLVDGLRPDIFHVDWMFWPVQINLGFYTLTPLNGLLSVPLQVSWGLVPASNLVLLSSYVLGGFGAYLLARDVLRQGRSSSGVMDAAPLAAGVIYAFASSKLFYASLGQFNIASSQWIPFSILYLLRLGRAGVNRQIPMHLRLAAGDEKGKSAFICVNLRPIFPGQGQIGRNAFLAALFFTLQAWSELTYASFLLIFAALFGLWLLVSEWPRLRRTGARIVTGFALFGALGLAGLSPFLWAMIPDMLTEGDFFASGGGFADVFSADLAGYLVPTRLHPLAGEWVAGLPFPNDKGQQIFVGYSALALAGIGAVALLRRHGWRGLFWPLMTLWFWLLTLGPQIRIAGQATPIPGPFTLISQLPFFSGNRYPSRYSVMLMLCVALLAAWGLAWTANRLHGFGWRRLLPGALVLLFLAEHLSIPLPLNDFRVPAIYRRIATEPGDFAVLELPTGWRNGARVLGRSDVLIMMQQWYQTVHGKRRLGGNTSRNPAYKFQYFTDAPLVGDLIALMNADVPGPDGAPYIGPVVDARWEELAARGRSQAAQVLDFLGVRFVLVHVEKASPQLLRYVEEILPVEPVETWQGDDWTGAPATIRLYRVKEAPAQPAWTINLSAAEARLHLAEGWSRLGVAGRIRYANRAEPTLLLDLPETGGELTLDVFGPARLEDVRLNGRSLVWVAGPRDGSRQPVQVEIPDGAAAALVDRLTLRFGPKSYNSLLIEAVNRDLPQPVGQTGATLPPGHGVVAVSAGADVGDAAHIFVTNRAGVGVDLAPGQRGYNLVALTPSGDLLDRAAFDILGDPRASAALAAWVQGLPTGTIVAGAVNDEASLGLGADAVAALRSLGAAESVQGRFRWSHAFIGVVGAAPGQAVEDIALLRPAVAVAGMPIDSPTVTGGVGRIHFERKNSQP